MLKEHRTLRSFFPWKRSVYPTVEESAARNEFELAALDQKRETLKNHLEVLSEISFNRRVEAAKVNLPNPVEAQDDLLTEYTETFHALEEQRDNILFTRKPEDRAELERWYRGKADDFRRLGERIDTLIARVKDLSLGYYQVKA